MMPIRIIWSCPYCANILSSRHWNVQRHINTIHFSGGRNAEPVDYRSGLTREQSKVWEYLCRRSYYQQQQQQQQQPSYYQQQQEQRKIVQQNQQIIALLTRLVNTI